MRGLRVWLFALAQAGLAFWLPIIPLDTIKTRQQTAPSGAINGAMCIARQIMRTRGMMGFYAGTAPILTRGVLLDIFQFSGADRLRNAQRSFHDRDSSGNNAPLTDRPLNRGATRP